MAQRGVEVYLYSSKTSALEGSEWSAARPDRTLPPAKTRYPLYRRLCGPQGWSGWAENLAPTGIRSPDRPAHNQSLYRLSYGLDGPGIECRWWRDFPPVQTDPGAHPLSCTMGTGSFPGLNSGRGVRLTPHLLAPRSWKSRAIPLPPSGPQPGL